VAKRTLGVEHPHTLLYVSDLIEIFKIEGYSEEAEKGDVQVIETMKM
jgi:hypothetical protein